MVFGQLKKFVLEVDFGDAGNDGCRCALCRKSDRFSVEYGYLGCHFMPKALQV